MWIKRILLITISIIGGFLSCSAQGKIERPSVHPKVTKGNINGHAYVDLGLPSGIKWATCNVGANYEYETGNYYSWGECNTKELYDPKHGATLGLNLDDISGNTKYDVARKIWGSSCDKGGTWMPVISNRVPFSQRPFRTKEQLTIKLSFFRWKEV